MSEGFDFVRPLSEGGCIWGDIAIFRDLIPPDTDILAYLVHIMTSTISPHKQQIRQFSLSPLSLSASGAGQGDFFVWEYDHVLILTQENDYRYVLYASHSHFGPEVLPCQGGGDVAAGLVHGVVHLTPSLQNEENNLKPMRSRRWDWPCPWDQGSV